MKNFLLGVIAAIVLAAVGGYLFLKAGYFPVNADAKPGELEEKLADMAVGAAVRRNAERKPNPIEANDKNLLDGLEKYRKNCVGCHGDGSGKNPFGEAFYPPVPQFADDPPGTHDDLIFYRIKHGIRLTGMPAFTSVLKDEEMWSIALFCSHLKKLPPAVDKAWKTPQKP